jgi:CHAD domain-containing protein
MRKLVRRGQRKLLENLQKRVIEAQNEQVPTAVHQLRVASRRLSESLRTFASFVPKKISRKIRKKLRAVRKVAGEVRKRDIVLAQLQEAGIPTESPLMDALKQDRERASWLLKQALDRWRKKDYLGRWQVKLRVCRCNECSASRSIAGLLPNLTTAFFAAGRQAVALGSPTLLHEFRLDAKKYRYTLELLQDLYGSELKNLLMAIGHVQDQLGEISDCATSWKLLQQYTGVDPSVQAKLEHYLDRKLNESLTDFRQYWRRWLDAPGQWVRFLSRSQR